MADFNKAIEVVFAHEGGYSNDSVDRGGETLFGLSRKRYPDLDFATLTRDKAKEIYRRDYWQYDWIKDQELATKIFDMAVNMGPEQAHKLLQRALGVTADGVIGPRTMVAFVKAERNALLRELRAQCAEFYCRLIVRDPSQLKFVKGWMRRAVS